MSTETETYPDLHPDLAPYLEPMEHFGQMLRHRLVYSVPYFGPAENERLNKYYEVQLQRLRKAQETKNHHLYVFTHERAYRLDALMELYGEIPAVELIPLILDVYIDSENISANADSWEQLLETLTGTDPWNTEQELPDGEFTIYRGGTKEGFSWTTDLEQAKWFANRWRDNHPVWKATVTKRDIIGYCDGRGEKEIIVNPADIAHLIEEKPITE